MRSSLTVLAPLAALVVPALAGCGSPSDRAAEGTGTASVAIEQVPSDVACVEIDVSGLNAVTQRFTVKPGSSSVLTVAGIPTGSVDISGIAWNAPCASVGSAPTWAAQSTPTTIVKGSTATVPLTFFPTTTTNVGVDFENETYRNVTTIAGSAQIVGTTDGVGAAARFNRPQFLANDGASLYAADGKNLTIRKIVLATGTVSTIAGNPAATGTGVDGIGAAATFNHPEGVALDGAGNLFVTDTSDNTIRKLVLATGQVTTIAGVAGQAGSTDGTGAAALFNIPFGIVADGHGNLFVADSGNATIRQIVLATNAVTTIAGAAGQTGTLNGVGVAARFQGPGGIACDGTSLYVTDGSAIRQMVLASGKVFTLAGDPTLAGTADGFGARFSIPEGVAFDAVGGNLFITDPGNINVRQYSFNTGLVTTVAGSPQNWGAIDANGPAAAFRLPIGVTVDPKGTVYVADTANDTIRRM
jgi:sugar lactone lactonase YvrE